MSAAAGVLQVALPSILAAIAVVALALVWRVYHSVPLLADEAAAPEGHGPLVSIIVAARNEAVHIRAAVASLLNQDYYNVEVIVVDDRSSDKTGEILDAMAAKTNRIAVEHIRELPAGWLGKNYALHRGASRATGEVLLFVDGDVMLERSAVGRAVRLMDDPGADHVVVLPQMDLPTWSMRLFVGYFLTWGCVFMRLWRVEDRRSSAFLGVGAFNMVRRSAYHAAGGHERIAMRPDDDLMLGKILKRSGAQPRLRIGIGMVSVEWYASLREATLGFRKNGYAAFNYNPWLFAGGTLGNLVSGVLPFAAVWFTSGTIQLLYGVTVAALLAAYAKTSIEQRLPVWLTLLYPIGALLHGVMVTIAVARTLAAGGIDWRGTFYPLAQLKANRV